MASPSPGAPTVDPSLGQVQVDQAAPAIAVQAPTLNVGDQADSSAQTREAASSAQGISEAPGPAGVATSNNAGQATPAIAGQPTLAIAGTLQPILATLDEIRAKPNDQKWIVNNSAIKWIRHDYEKPPGVPTCGMVDITQDPIRIGVVSREKGKAQPSRLWRGKLRSFRGARCCDRLTKRPKRSSLAAESPTSCSCHFQKAFATSARRPPSAVRAPNSNMGTRPSGTSW